jgi:hypothetical protein
MFDDCGYSPPSKPGKSDKHSIWIVDGVLYTVGSIEARTVSSTIKNHTAHIVSFDQGIEVEI